MARRVLRKIVKIDEEKCDGCGACIPACPEGALQIVEGKVKLVKESLCDGLGACVKECPKGALTIEEREAEPFELSEQQRLEDHQEFSVGGRGIVNWPVKLELLNPRAPILNNCDLVVSADCVPFVYASFQERVKGRVVVSGCPIFGDRGLYRDKLAGMLKHNEVLSLSVLRMEVPCCAGLTEVVREALRRAGKQLTVDEHVVTINGEVGR